MKRAVFLDRDGVLNLSEVREGKPYAPRQIDDFQLYPEAALALRRLKAAGFALIVVTNQPDIASRRVTAEAVEAMHQRLRAALPVDEVVLCPHGQDEGCACRKPRPGMLTEAARRHHIDLAASVMVGDRASDVEAGRAAGCRTIFIDRAYGEPAPAAPDRVVRSLTEAVDAILAPGDRS